MRALDAARRALGGHDAKAALPETVTLRSIGIVRSSLRDLRYRDATRQRATLEILPEFAPALDGLEGFSHVIVLTWLHLVADDERTLASPVASGASAPTMRGALALRTHHRPNPIGLSVVNLDRVLQCRLEVTGLDAVDGTPILDIKPYLPPFDSVPGARLPTWATGEA